MQHSYFDTDVGKAEFALIRDQKHIDYVWPVMQPIVKEYIDGFLDGVARSDIQRLPHDNVIAFIKKIISDNDTP